jgi:hypothetical protein
MCHFLNGESKKERKADPFMEEGREEEHNNV